jgi:hypothetical protein
MPGFEFWVGSWGNDIVLPFSDAVFDRLDSIADCSAVPVRWNKIRYVIVTVNGGGKVWRLAGVEWRCNCVALKCSAVKSGSWLEKRHFGGFPVLPGEAGGRSDYRHGTLE